MLRMVDLPQPDGPTMATNSRSWTSKETGETAGTSRGALAEGLREVPDGDADARRHSRPLYLYLACAFLTKLMSTACLYGIGLSTAVGTHTFMPRS